MFKNVDVACSENAVGNNVYITKTSCLIYNVGDLINIGNKN